MPRAPEPSTREEEEGQRGPQREASAAGQMARQPALRGGRSQVQLRSSARKAEPLGRSNTHSDRLSPPSGVCVTADRERGAQNPAHQGLHTQSSEIQANHLRVTPDKLKQRSDKLLGVGDSSSRDLVGGLTPKRAASFFICGPTPGASLPRPPSRAFQGGAAGGLQSQPHPLFDSGT